MGQVTDPVISYRTRVSCLTANCYIHPSTVNYSCMESCGYQDQPN